MTPWGWKPERSQGIWRHGPLWLKPLSVAAPWISLGLLVLMLHMTGGTMTSAEGVLFELPDSGLADGDVTSLVALVMPMPDETYVFFDDARYSLGSGPSTAAFGSHLSDRAGKVESKTLLVMADKSVAYGELAKISAIARMSGMKRILFAGKKPEARAE